MIWNNRELLHRWDLYKQKEPDPNPYTQMPDSMHAKGQLGKIKMYVSEATSPYTSTRKMSN